MKAVLFPKEIAANADLSTSYISPVEQVIESDVTGFQINYTGAPVGSFAVEVSADYNKVTGVGNWIPLTLSVNGALVNGLAVPSNTSPIYIDIYGCSMPYVRIHYTSASGSGSANIYMLYKRLGD